MRHQKPIYVLPHGIEVIGEYAPTAKNPYWRVRIRPHPFFPNVRDVHGGIGVRRNRVILASTLGRAPTRAEVAHHANEDRADDAPHNIVKMSPAEHNRHHKLGSRHRPESKAKTSASVKLAYATGRKLPIIRLGAENHAAKLTEAQVREIRAGLLPSRATARQYGVSKQVILAIRSRKTWRHI